jgi:peptide/nickel transport system substrate-binding protein
MPKKFSLLMVLSVLMLAVLLVTTGWAGQSPAAKEKTFTFAVQDLGTEKWWPQAGGYQSLVNQSVGDSLTRVHSPWVVKPGIASSWTVSPDGLKWEFILRDDAFYTDGTKVTPQDAIMVLDGRKDYVGWSGLKANITTMEARGNRLIINLSNPVPQMLDNYLGWIPIRPKPYIDKVGWDGYNKLPIGAGPFKFVEHKRGEYAILEKNDKYFGKKPSIDKVVLKIVREPSTRIAQLRTGEADATFNELGANTAELARYGFKAKAAGPPSQDWLFFNRLSRPSRVKSNFDDVRVRIALLHAIDRAALGKAIYHQLGEGGGNVFGVGKAMGDAYYNKSLPAHAYDPAKAKQLLAEAGFPNGFKTEIRTYPAKKDLAQAVASYWTQVGVQTTVKLDDSDGATMEVWYKHLEEGDFAFIYHTVAIGIVDLFAVDSKAISCAFASPETDLRDVGDRIVGTENQAKWVRDVFSPTMYKHMPILPLTETPLYVIGLGPRIKNWAEVDYRTLGFEYVELTD